MRRYAADAVIVGAAPNGLGAALALPCKGRSVLIFDRGGPWRGRAGDLTLPGFVHDVLGDPPLVPRSGGG